VDGGERQRFGAWGLGRSTGEKGEVYPWFTHGSNAAQSAVRADGADGELLLFEAAGRYAKEYTAGGAAWNKDSDLNIQVLAVRNVDTGAAEINPASLHAAKSGGCVAARTWKGEPVRSCAGR